jgi:hypothetical protein
MPLKKGSSQKTISMNIRELKKDNMKKGKARGQKGKPRSQAQIIAIALDMAGKLRRK